MSLLFFSIFAEPDEGKGILGQVFAHPLSIELAPWGWFSEAAPHLILNKS
jgi:hypothetical protein